MSVVVVVGALALVLAGCGSATDTSAAAGTDSGGSDSTLAFSGTTIDGESFQGEELAGKPAVLWFWAPWCPTCRSQVPAVEAVAEQYAGEVNVVGVGGLSEEAAIADFARGVEGPTHLVDVDGEVWRHFGITAQSTYVLLDQDGSVVQEGVLDNDQLPAEVADLVG